MPHQCTGCGHVFPDGSKEMLSGCPECGGNKFQFLPEGTAAEPEAESETPSDPEPASESEDAILADHEAEDRAQADARSSVVDSAELPSRTPETDSDDESDLSQLREELNDQFESIRIVDHGQYELNLMELYKREEFIIALQENGRYVIEVPESLRRGSER